MHRQEIANEDNLCFGMFVAGQNNHVVEIIATIKYQVFVFMGKCKSCIDIFRIATVHMHVSVCWEFIQECR